ncbi:hypothetical protein [Ramlibacter alkalitolerans]|uniref:Uncharacterized protein n=1 Tax=Ramlibacter alkalitolerans TaxID=2039631 RepID=A0ABS1JU15_9BURK|nr:hypothetical protein [Ramlibacter alkalitolerans]MBL0427656.1 hypothetical protein [Ramlibacter alkalitolerans]
MPAVVSLLDAAKARGIELPHHTQSSQEPAGDDLLYDGKLAFGLKDMHADSQGRVFFSSPKALQLAKNVFANWGVDLDDYTGDMREFLAVWYALCGKSCSDLSLSVNHGIKRQSEHQERYIRAVAAGDRQLARKLLPSSETAKFIADEIRKSRLEQQVEQRPVRPDARENAVVAFLLAQPVARGSNTSIGDAFDAMFAQHRDSKDVFPTWVYDRFRKAHGQKAPDALWRQGLHIMTAGGCPVGGEVAVLFHWENLQRRMDRSKLKNDWRALLGPFAGFDQRWRLLMEADLAAFAAENPHVPAEWKRPPTAPTPR